MKTGINKILCHVISMVLALGCLCACSSGTASASSSGGTVLGSSGKEIRIVSGSENKELEGILEAYAEKNNVKIVMTYEGSLDIMHDLEQDDIPYDAVWPASSVWLNAGDTQHRVKHTESISINPVVFGIRKSLAEELGFVGREVSVKEILAAIQAGKLKFCMTSATQSNSGASAYIGFLYALLGNPDVITKEDLNNQEMQDQLKELLSGIDRSSGSSDWLKEMFVKGDFDAMVNYECLMISADNELVEQGKEPLYVVYPYDGLSIADSPLGYVDHGDDKAEERFLALQEYLLSADVQSQIQRTGRRSSYTGINEENKDVFKEEWGLQPDRVISPFRMPDADTLMAALDLYQTQLRKPSMTAYCLDFSGSMKGDGEKQLKAAITDLGAYYITKQEMVDDNVKQNAMIIDILSIFTYLALVIASIGIFNNISISFAQRRKEFAVMASVGVNVPQRRRMILSESITGVIWSAAASIPYTMLLCVLAQKLLEQAGLGGMDITFSWAQFPIYLAVVAFVIFLASIGSMRSIGRLKVVEELKYE